MGARRISIISPNFLYLTGLPCRRAYIQIMAQPDPLQIANHLHAAADQIGLFTTLSADSKASILQRILDDIDRFRSDITRLESKLAIV